MQREAAIIDRTILEAAFSYNARDHRAYLDLVTGQVIAVRGDRLRDAVYMRRFAVESRRFVAIEPVPAAEQHRWMTDFVATIADNGLRAQLTAALDGAGAFRRFKDVLRSDTAARRRWFLLRSTLVSAYIDAWFAANGLSGALPDPTATAAAADGPTEQRSRQAARAQLEGLSDDGLRLAIDYLRHHL